MAISNSQRRAQLERQRVVERPPSAWASWLSVYGVLALLAACVASNAKLYLSEDDGLDVLVLGGTLLAIFSGLIPKPPKNVASIGLAIGAFLVVVLISLKNEWRGTPVELIVRSVATIVLSSCCFFAGAALRQRATPKSMMVLQMGVAVLLAAVLVVTFGILHTAKNVMGGTMFALSMLTIAVLYVRTGKFTIATGLTGGALIVVGAFLTNHRAMMVLGAGIGALLVVFALYRPRWARVLPPIAAIVVAIGAVVVLTQMTQSSMFVQADQTVKEESGRTLKSGRETFWGIVVDAIADGPLVGYGPTKKAQDITGLQFSTHNAFLQVGLQTGVIGLLMVFILFVVLIARAVNAPVSEAGAILAVYIAGVIVHNSSENVLFMNNFPIAAITWLNMGFLSASCFLAPLGAARSEKTPTSSRARQA